MASDVPNVEKFMSQFVELYDSNNTLRESLVVSLAKNNLWKLTPSHNNPIIKEKVTGFIRILGT